MTSAGKLVTGHGSAEPPYLTIFRAGIIMTIFSLSLPTRAGLPGARLMRISTSNSPHDVSHGRPGGKYSPSLVSRLPCQRLSGLLGWLQGGSGRGAGAVRQRVHQPWRTAKILVFNHLAATPHGGRYPGRKLGEIVTHLQASNGPEGWLRDTLLHLGMQKHDFHLPGMTLAFTHLANL
jgi:hypothetical protein